MIHASRHETGSIGDKCLLSLQKDEETEPLARRRESHGQSGRLKDFRLVPARQLHFAAFALHVEPAKK